MSLEKLDRRNMIPNIIDEKPMNKDISMIIGKLLFPLVIGRRVFWKYASLIALSA